MKIAKPITDPRRNQLKLFVIVLFGAQILLLMHNAQAEVLKDPTQPAALPGETNAADGRMASGPVLQSVMIGSNYRAAIINGQKVMLGGKYEQATLIRVNEHEALLRNSDKSTQKLVMDYAGMKKTMVTAVKAKNDKPLRKNN